MLIEGNILIMAPFTTGIFIYSMDFECQNLYSVVCTSVVFHRWTCDVNHPHRSCFVMILQSYYYKLLFKDSHKNCILILFQNKLDHSYVLHLRPSPSVRPSVIQLYKIQIFIVSNIQIMFVSCFVANLEVKLTAFCCYIHNSPFNWVGNIIPFK